MTNRRRKPKNTLPPLIAGIMIFVSVIFIGIIAAMFWLFGDLWLLPCHDCGRDATGGTHGLSEGDLGEDRWGGTSGRAPDDEH